LDEKCSHQLVSNHATGNDLQRMLAGKPLFKNHKMKLGVIKYSQEFVMPNGLKRWIGAEWPIDIESQVPLEVFLSVEKMVNGFNQSSVPDVMPEPNVIQVENPYSATGNLESDIRSCKTIEMIDTYRLIVDAKGFEWAKDVYRERRAELVRMESDALISAANNYKG
jgi:hypothetical protein